MTGDLTNDLSIKTAKLPSLTGHENYVVWAAAWKLVFRSKEWMDVVDGTTLEPTDSEERKKWMKINNDAHTTLVSAVSQELLVDVVTADKVSTAWRALKDRFDRDTSNSTIALLKSIVDY